MLRWTRWCTDSPESTAPARSFVPPMSTPIVRRPGMPSLYGSMPSDLGQPPYKLYRAGPKGLWARLRGEEDELRVPAEYRTYRGSGREGPRRRITVKRVIVGLLIALVAWLLLSF